MTTAVVLCLVLPERPFLTNAAPQQTAEVDRLAELEEANRLDEQAGELYGAANLPKPFRWQSVYLPSVRRH
jgi:hypothetical protein